MACGRSRCSRSWRSTTTRVRNGRKADAGAASSASNVLRRQRLPITSLLLRGAARSGKVRSRTSDAPGAASAARALAAARRRRRILAGLLPNTIGLLKGEASPRSSTSATGADRRELCTRRLQPERLKHCGRSRDRRAGISVLAASVASRAPQDSAGKKMIIWAWTVTAASRRCLLRGHLALARITLAYYASGTRLSGCCSAA